MTKWHVLAILVAGLSAAGAVAGISVAMIAADQERTAQMKACVSAGGSFVSGDPTLCIGGARNE